MDNQTSNETASGGASATVTTATAERFGARDWALTTAAWMLMLTASLLNLLNFNEYSLFRPEVALVLLALALIAVVLGTIAKIAPRLAFIFTGALVLLGIDLNSTSTWLPIAFGSSALIGAFISNRNVVKLALAGFGTVALFQLGTAAMAATPESQQPKVNSAPGNAALPPVIHLLMDSALGVEGMESSPAFDELQDDTEDFFEKHHFRLYNDAYSRHANTANSVPYLLSFGTAEPAAVSQMDERQVPEQFDYFELLAKRGYKISVTGADFIDLCTGQPIVQCSQFPHSKLNAITEFPLSVSDRAATIGFVLAGASPLLNHLHDYSSLLAWYYGGPEAATMRNLKKIGSLKSALAMQDMEDSLPQVKPGHVYFSHLLMPHEPYVFDEDCDLKPRALWGTEKIPNKRLEREKIYGEQMQCMFQLLDTALTSLDKTEAGRKAIIVIHGDHGSRIVDDRPIAGEDEATPRDFGMTYSTLFAIRAPGIEQGEPEGRAALEDLLEDFARSDFRSAPDTEEEPSEVILSTNDWLPKERVPLPNFDPE